MALMQVRLLNCTSTELLKQPMASNRMAGPI